MNRQEIIDRLKGELENLNKELDNAEVKLQKLSGEAKEAYAKQMVELKGLLAEARKKYDQAVDSADETWKDVQGNIEFTARALKNSVNYFLSHFRNRKEK